MRSIAWRHLVAILLLSLGIVASEGARRLRPEATPWQVDFSRVPEVIAGEQRRELPYDREIAEYLEADAMRTFAWGEGERQVIASLIYGRSWRTVHTPAQCLPAQGWSIISDDEVVIPTSLELPHPPPVLGRLLRVERDGAVELVLFIFAHKGGTSTNYAEHSLAVMTGPRGAGGLSLMLTTPVFSEHDELAARARLVAFAGELYPYAVAFWYPDWTPGTRRGEMTGAGRANDL